MFRSILVPLDGSPLGEQALPLAVSLARRVGAALEVAHVLVTPAPLYSERAAGMENTLDARAREGARAYLDGVLNRLAQSGVPVTSALLEGGVAESIEGRVKARGIDLVVLTTHGRGAFSRFWLGSVTDRLIRRLEVPLLAVRPQEGPLDLSGGPVPQHFLLPLDGSPLAEQALEPALELARLAQARCTLLRVVKPIVVAPADLQWSAALGSDEAIVRELADEARAYLERVAGRLRREGQPVEARVVLHPRPAAAILEEARTAGADLIALGTHGYGGVKRVLLGSVADKVLRGATTPVLVYRPAEV
ncbi:MAG TPA: universal stress protein [Gemmataceae bacterium]|nr:universal stress protein [Gemmataceae bacterium]